MAYPRQVFEERLPNGRRVPSPRRPRQQRQQRSEGRRPPRQDGLREERYSKCVNSNDAKSFSNMTFDSNFHDHIRCSFIKP